MHRRFGDFKRQVVLAGVLAAGMGWGTSSALAASAGCNTVNALSGNAPTQMQTRIDASQFEAGDSFVASFTNNGSQYNGNPTTADAVRAHANDSSTFWTYSAANNPGGNVTKSYDSAFLTGHGLWLMWKTEVSITGLTFTCTSAQAPATLTVSPTTFPTATYGQSYSQTLTTSGGTAPYTYSITVGSLPSGVTLSSGGALAGEPIEAGTKNLTVRVTDSAPTPNTKDTALALTVAATVPDAPSLGGVLAEDGQASITVVAPGRNGGSAITVYTVTSSPGGMTGTRAGPSGGEVVITGLTNGTPYTFTATATNGAGTGPASAASASVTPKAAQTITFINPGAQNFGTSPTLSASTTSGLSVGFTSSSSGVCAITSGGSLTFHTAGTCTINADQPGNGEWNAATTVSRSFTVNATVPGAPVMGTATPGDSQASVVLASCLQRRCLDHRLYGHLKSRWYHRLRGWQPDRGHRSNQWGELYLYCHRNQ